MPKIIPCLWFAGQAEEAANLYISLFKNSKILSTALYPENAPGQAGTIMTVNFEIEGQEFIALNGGPLFQFNESISFAMTCEDQTELDRLWYGLTANGGEEVQCGWLKDKFGVSWQITPKILEELLSDPDKEKTDRVFQALLNMVKLDIEGLKKAYSGV
ncbi:MAG: VOC family protein [Anaerolineaceae bacterium]|nr:VOC family protein [Anaerolineaceae bacterium]